MFGEINQAVTRVMKNKSRISRFFFIRERARCENKR